jgi:hypothetical protein
VVVVGVLSLSEEWMGRKRRGGEQNNVRTRPWPRRVAPQPTAHQLPLGGTRRGRFRKHASTRASLGCASATVCLGDEQAAAVPLFGRGDVDGRRSTRSARARGPPPSDAGTRRGGRGSAPNAPPRSSRSFSCLSGSLRTRSAGRPVVLLRRRMRKAVPLAAVDGRGAVAPAQERRGAACTLAPPPTHTPNFPRPLATKRARAERLSHTQPQHTHQQPQTPPPFLRARVFGDNEGEREETRTPHLLLFVFPLVSSPRTHAERPPLDTDARARRVCAASPPTEQQRPPTERARREEEETHTPSTRKAHPLSPDNKRETAWRPRRPRRRQRAARTGRASCSCRPRTPASARR